MRAGAPQSEHARDLESSKQQWEAQSQSQEAKAREEASKAAVSGLQLICCGWDAVDSCLEGS